MRGSGQPIRSKRDFPGQRRCLRCFARALPLRVCFSTGHGHHPPRTERKSRAEVFRLTTPRTADTKLRGARHSELNGVTSSGAVSDACTASASIDAVTRARLLTVPAVPGRQRTCLAVPRCAQCDRPQHSGVRAIGAHHRDPAFRLHIKQGSPLLVPVTRAHLPRHSSRMLVRRPRRVIFRRTLVAHGTCTGVSHVYTSETNEAD